MALSGNPVVLGGGGGGGGTIVNGYGYFADGTAAAPSISFLSDQDTGIYLAGANTLGFSTAGTLAFSIDGSGNWAFAKSGTISVGATTSAVTDLLINPTTKASGFYLRMAVNGTSNVAFGLDTDAPTYGRITFNDNLSPTGTVGIAGKPTDNNMYIDVPTGGSHYFRTNGTIGVTLTNGAGTFTGLVLTPATASGSAGLRLPHGTAPSSPVNGDLWTTTAGLFVRINGVTVGPLS